MRATLPIFLAWLAWAVVSILRGLATGTLPNALAGDVAQSAAFATLAGAAVLVASRRPPELAERAGLAVMILLLAISVALGHPWHGLAGAPWLALALAPLAVALVGPRAMALPAMLLAAAAWVAASARLVAAEPDVALLSYVIPGAILLAAALPILIPPASPRAAWT